jgi:rhamnogalacturonyl hydrolase YesR
MKLKMLLFVFASSGYLSLSASNISQPVWVKKSVETATFQLKQMSSKLYNKTGKEVFPRSVKDGQIKLVDGEDWTSGFFPGSLWYAYELTGDKKMLENARYYTNKLESIQYFTGNHDIGFIMYCSYGNARRLSPQKSDSSILVNSAISLTKRFFPKVGQIRSWDNERWAFPVIIDNMMNLELLFAMSKTTGNPLFRDIAIKHADKTMENHFRKDMSSYHVVSYNPETGLVETKETHQGYSNESAWSRGQAWGLYGYTVCYRETGDKKYLKQAKAIASYIMNCPVMPKDKVPYWDYNAPKIPNEPRDASAGAVTASALLELYTITGEKQYFSFAETTLKSLSSKKYLAKVGCNHNFILMHSVGSIPGKFEVDTPLNYADYYYLEGLMRYVNIWNKLNKKNNL